MKFEYYENRGHIEKMKNNKWYSGYSLSDINKQFGQLAPIYQYAFAFAFVAVVALAGAVVGVSWFSVTEYNTVHSMEPKVDALESRFLGDNPALAVTSTSIIGECGGADIDFCATTEALQTQLALLEYEVDLLTAFLINGTLSGIGNLTLSNFSYSNSESFMWNVTNAKQALDNVVLKLADLQTQITAQTALVSSLNGQVVALNANISTLFANFNALNSTVAGLVTTVATLSGQISTINTHLSTLDQQVYSLNQTVITLAASVTTLSGQLAAINANISTIFGQITTINTQIAALLGSVVQEISVRPAAMGGDDSTCGPAGGHPCATVTKALSFVPNSLGNFNLWRINIRGYVIESAGLALKCNTIIQGDDNTYIQAAGFSYDSNSFGANVACTILVRNAFFVPTSPSIMDASNYTSMTFFSAKYENFSTQGASNQPWSMLGNSNYAQVTFNDVGNGGASISSLSITNMLIVAIGYFDAAATLSVKFDNKDGYLNLNGLRVPTGGFFVNNTNSHTLTFEGADWTNPNSNYFAVNTDAGSSSYLRGACAFQGVINFNGSYGPIITGAGSVFTTLTEGTVGMGHKQLVLTYYNGVVYANLRDIIESFAKRLYDLENAIAPSTLSSQTGAFLTGATAAIGSNFCDFNVNLNVGPVYSSAGSNFAAGGLTNIIYNGSASGVFLFSFSSMIEITYSALGSTTINIGSAIIINGVNTRNKNSNISPVTGGTIREDVEFTVILFLSPGDSIVLNIGVSTALASTFTGCGLYTTLENTFYHITQVD